MIPVIYYAHSMSTYGTEREAQEVKLIEESFFRNLVYNPNRKSIQRAKNPMKECLKIVKDSSLQGLVFSPRDGFISMGVYAEIKTAQKMRLPIYHIAKEKIMLFRGELKLVKQDKKTHWAKVL